MDSEFPLGLASGTSACGGGAGFLRAELPHCRGAISRFARHLTRNRDEAEDLVQDTLVRAYQGAETFSGSPTREALLRWLAAIMRNHFYNLCRHKKRWGRSETLPLNEATEGFLWHETGADNASIEGVYEQRQWIASLLRAMENLPPAQQEVLSLSVFGHLSYEEISQRLGLPVGTVRSRLHRARGRLAQATVSWHDVRQLPAERIAASGEIL